MPFVSAAGGAGGPAGQPGLDVDDHVGDVGRPPCRCRCRRGRGRPRCRARSGVSSPSWPSTRSPAPAPGSSVSLPRPPKNVSASSPPVMRSSPEPASTTTAISAPRPGADVERVVAAERVELEELAGGDVERERGVGAVVADLARRRRLSEETSSAAPRLFSMRSRPSSPFMASLPSPLFHTSVSSPELPFMTSLPGLPRMRSPPAPPLSVSTPVAALDEVGAVTRGDGVVAGTGVDRRRERRAGGAGERVRARERVDVQALRAHVDVDLDRGADAVEVDAPRSPASGADAHHVVRGAVVEQRLVGAVAAVVDVVAVAVVPDHHVVAGAAADRLLGRLGRVVRAAGEAVVAVAAPQRVEVRTTGDDVVAGTAVDRQRAAAAVRVWSPACVESKSMRESRSRAVRL